MKRDTPLSPRTRRTVFALIFGVILLPPDTSVVNVAIRPLTQIFDTTVTVAQWVITGYALASVVGIVITSFASRRFGVTASLAHREHYLHNDLVGMCPFSEHPIPHRILCNARIHCRAVHADNADDPHQ